MAPLTDLRIRTRQPLSTSRSRLRLRRYRWTSTMVVPIQRPSSCRGSIFGCEVCLPTTRERRRLLSYNPIIAGIEPAASLKHIRPASSGKGARKCMDKGCATATDARNTLQMYMRCPERQACLSVDTSEGLKSAPLFKGEGEQVRLRVSTYYARCCLGLPLVVVLSSVSVRPRWGR